MSFSNRSLWTRPVHWSHVHELPARTDGEEKVDVANPAPIESAATVQKSRASYVTRPIHSPLIRGTASQARWKPRARVGRRLKGRYSRSSSLAVTLTQRVQNANQEISRTRRIVPLSWQKSRIMPAFVTRIVSSSGKQSCATV